VKRSSQPILQRVSDFLSSQSPGCLDAPLLVAVSGGPDSICLLHALHRVAPQFSLRLHVAHLHHGQRREGDADAKFVQESAKNLGWACTVAQTDVPALARNERLSLEMAGRLARYRFFSRLAEEIGANAAATGHNADDQAETVLVRALRGAGNPGLRGIPAVAPMPESQGRVTVLRPLLSVSRSEIEVFLKEGNLPSILDATNLDLSLQRNRIRRELLPLAEAISPGAKKGLLRIAREAAEDEEALAALAKDAWNSAVQVQDSTVMIDLSRLIVAPALRRRTFRRALQTLVSDKDAISEEAVERLLALSRAIHEETARPASLSLPHGVLATRSGDRLRLEMLSAPFQPFRYPVSLPGQTALPELGFTLVAEETTSNRLQEFPPRNAYEAIVDGDRLHPPVHVRSWEPGDRMRVFGSGGTRKLQDLFTEARIPPSERRRWPVLCDSARIVWVPGLCLNDEAKVMPETKKALRLRFESDAEEKVDL
jgi:tRNA(Ile)-lysidine synthase